MNIAYLLFFAPPKPICPGGNFAGLGSPVKKTNKTVMYRLFVFCLFLSPLSALAQFSVSGRVLNQIDAKPVASASVFLSNATIGAKTAADGTFTLHNVNPGKYSLVVSVIGFEAFDQTITISNGNLTLPDITVFPKSIGLKEVVIKPDVNRERNYLWFKDQFLGTSPLAADCKIINPQILDLDYDETTNTLTASSTDFLEIENNALGYKIRYLLKNFSLEKGDKKNKIYYQGSVLYQEMKGTPAQERRWQQKRKDVYENSEMHFLRSVLDNRIAEEGFKVQQLAIYTNPERPDDGLIEAKLDYFKKSGQSDSLSFWKKKAKLPKTLQKLMRFPLNSDDILSQTNKKEIFALGCDNDALYVTYNKDRHFNAGNNINYVNDAHNTAVTLINFPSPFAYFYNNGVIINPFSVFYNGVWANERVAELLPIDYDPGKDALKTLPPADSTAAKNITHKLSAYFAGHIAEQTYLHLDKPHYAAGDTIYFKAYVTQGEKHGLSAISGVLHVDLINPANKAAQSVKLQIIDGVGWGDFALPDTLPKGNYRIRAYTRWMLNGGTDNYFDQLIPIGSLHTGNIPESATARSQTANKPDFQFFPEGGTLVTGVNCKVAFKAIAGNGLGVAVKGQVLDNDGKQITTFASAHLGMGSFDLYPQEGKTYKARLTYPDGSGDVVDLPMPDAKGIVLSVNNDSKSRAIIKIAAGNAFYRKNKNKDYTLVIYSGGEASTFICKLDSPVISFNVLKQDLHTGVASITLFSPLSEPLGERLIFVQNNDLLKMGISSDKATYAKREKISLKLNAKDATAGPASGHFSVSVIDESKVAVDENKESTILTNLLLTNDLKGYVEQPNYYFSNITDKTADNLDLVMLTHGYHRFAWKPLLNDQYAPVAYQPQKALEISGIAKYENGKPLAKGSVSLVSLKGGPMLNQVLGDDGAFSFGGLSFMDSTSFVIKAVSEKSKNNSTTITLGTDGPKTMAADTNLFFNQYDIDKRMAVYLENRKAQLDEIAKYGPLKGIVLKEVNIQSVKKANYPSSNIGGPGYADQVIRRGDIKRSGGTFSSQYNGRIIGVKFAGPEGNKKAYLNMARSIRETPMLIILDGMELSGDSSVTVDMINVDDIETIEVLRSSTAAIYGMRGSAGVLVITTRRGAEGAATPQIPGVSTIYPKGFYLAREFYAPKYDHQENSFNRKDLRSTVYWNPELVTDKDGNAVFNYYNADGTGSYRVVIEGIDSNGNLGRQVYRYKVQ